MKRIASILLLAAALATSSGAAYAQSGWKKHSFPADGFEVSFSALIDSGREDLRKQTDNAVLSEARFTQNNTVGGYAVWVTTLAQPATNWEERAEAAFAAIGCSQVADKRTVEVSGVRMLHFSGTGCVKGVLNVTGRFTQVGNRIYQLMAVFAPIQGEAESAQYFLDSFAIIPVK